MGVIEIFGSMGKNFKVLLEWRQDIHFFCSGIVPASEYLFSAPRGLKKKVSFQRVFARYFLAISSVCAASPDFQRVFARYLLAISSVCAASPDFYDLRLF